MTALLVLADRVRRRWLRWLGPLGRRLVRDRELRVATVFAAVVVSALSGTLLAPLWLLVLGPLLWGVPHIAADIRYLVVRTGFSQRRILWVAAGVPLLAIGAGVDLVWGFVGAAAVALCARASWSRRSIAAAAVLGAGLLFARLGPASDVVFGHLHNFGAVAFWWLWRPRRSRLHWLPIGLLIVACALLVSDLGISIVGARFEWHASGDSADRQLFRLAPGLEPMLGMRLVLLFCFMQSVHYAMWMQMIPDEERVRATVVTFRATAAGLQRDLGTVAVCVIVSLSVGLVLWASYDMLEAGRGYFRMARFHGHLELMAAVLLWLERAPPRRPRARARTQGCLGPPRPGPPQCPDPGLFARARRRWVAHYTRAPGPFAPRPGGPVPGPRVVRPRARTQGCLHGGGAAGLRRQCPDLGLFARTLPRPDPGLFARGRRRWVAHWPACWPTRWPPVEACFPSPLRFHRFSRS